jgi:hypothetical protein
MFATIDHERTLQALLDVLLTAEDHLAGRRSAKISVTVGKAEAVTVTLTASGEGETVPENGIAARSSLTAGLQAWAAAHLAATQHGRLDVIDTENGRKYVMRLPAILETQD